MALRMLVCALLCVSLSLGQQTLRPVNDGTPPLPEVDIGDGITLIPTPHGWRPRQCVFKWPSGTHIKNIEEEERTEVVLPDNSTVSLPRLPECMRTYQNPLAQHSRISDGWLDNTGYYTNQAEADRAVWQFSGYYTVPTTPTQTGGLLYYFIGAENKGGNLGLTIIQPVLTYYGKWYMNSWNCCPNGQSHESASIAGFGPGDQVFGNMFESGGELAGTWHIESQYCPSSSCQTTWLNVTDSNREFIWIDATLETYYVTNCNQLSSGLMTYDKMALTTTNPSGQTQSTSIVWYNYTPTSACNGRTTVYSSQKVTIQHN